MSSDTTNNNLNLSILIHQDGLYFLTYSPDLRVHYNHSLSLYNSTPKKLLDEIVKTLGNKEQLQLSNFDKVNLIFRNELFTQVPKTYFNPEIAADYLKYNTQILETDSISYDLLPQIDLACVFIPYQNIVNYFVENTSKVHYYHYASLLAKHASPLQQAPPKDSLALIDLCKTHFFLHIKQDGKMLFNNYFNYLTKEDILYYTGFAYRELQLELNKAEIQSFNATPDCTQLIQNYCSKVTNQDQELALYKKTLCV